MTSSAFIPSATFKGVSLINPSKSPSTCIRVPVHRYQTTPMACEKVSKKTSSDSSKGLFGRFKDAIMKPIVTVPGGGTGDDLLECIFCKGSGFNDCDACRGSGKDALGTCMMCDGKCYLKCTVCSGVGAVDRIRRGGTDDQNEYIIKRKRKK